MRKNFIKNRKGTALLVALLVMGVLMAVSLALSALIFRETRITREFIDSGQAYYAAESAIELGLYGLNNNLPGWEIGGGGSGGGYEAVKVDNAFDAVAELKVKNRCQAYPCFDEDFDKNTAEPKEFYAVLGLNESITIPLFVVENVDGNAVVQDITDFVVEFYAPFDPKTDFVMEESVKDLLSGWDVLRWKIIGIGNQSGKPLTETISDFTAVSMMNKAGKENIPSNATKPSWFGTIDCNTVDPGKRYTDKIDCEPYFVGSPGGKQIEVDPEEFGQVSKVYAGTCSQTEAREYYQYQYFGDERDVASIEGCYSIGKFLEKDNNGVSSHTLNYLTLTNLINPSVFSDDKVKREALGKLYYRVELFTDDGKEAANTVREYADLTANGYSGNSKKSINVRIKKDSFMPVFNFSLYSTYMTNRKEADGEVHNEDYWYGSEDKGNQTL